MAFESGESKVMVLNGEEGLVMGFVWSMSWNLNIWGMFWMNLVQMEWEEDCRCHQVPG